MTMTIVAESVGRLEGSRALERTGRRTSLDDGVHFPQSNSPICRVVWYKNKRKYQKIDL